MQHKFVLRVFSSRDAVFRYERNFALISGKCARGDLAALHFRHQRSTFFEFALVCAFFARICARFALILRSFAAA